MGFDWQQNDHIPPDPNGAAGRNSLIAVTNTLIEGLSKNGTTIFAPTDLSDMFSTLALTFMTDPRILYDVEADRFVLVILCDDSDSRGSGESGGGSKASMSKVLVAASKNGNPLSAGPSDWYYLEINSFVENMVTDFPGLAVDNEAIYITGHLLNKDDDLLIKPLLWVLPKSLLYSGTATEADVHRHDIWMELTGQPPSGIVTMPARVRGNSSTPGAGTYLVTVTQEESVGIYQVMNPTTNTSFNLTILPFGPLGDGTSTLNLNLLPDAPQKGSERLIDTAYTRVLDAVWADASLWIVFDVTDGTAVMACWLKFNTETLSLSDQGCIRGEDIGPGTFTYYPSLDVNSKGVVAFGFAASSPSMYASAFAAIRDDVSDSLGTVRQPEMVREGEAPYHVLNLGGTEDKNRWGDYTGMSLDPSDDDCFWAFNEFASSGSWLDKKYFGSWKSAWARLCYPPKKHSTTKNGNGSKSSKSGSKSKRASGSEKTSGSMKSSSSRKGSGSMKGSRSMKGSGSMKGSRSKKGSRRN